MRLGWYKPREIAKKQARVLILAVFYVGSSHLKPSACKRGRRLATGRDGIDTMAYDLQFGSVIELPFPRSEPSEDAKAD